MLLIVNVFSVPEVEVIAVPEGRDTEIDDALAFLVMYYQ